VTWDAFYTYDSETGGSGETEELQVRRSDGGLQFRIVSRPSDEEGEGDVLWTSDEDLAGGDIVEALEEAIAERDLSADLLDEIAEGLEPHLAVAERRALKARLVG